MKHLFPNPQTDEEIRLEMAYQLGLSEGKTVGFAEGVEAAQAQMRVAQAVVQSAMGIMEDLGA